jgi:hypothetical protein
MKRDRQIGVRVGLPVFFALELEDVYKRASGAHRALAFPDFCGFLLGLGLEEYRRRHIRREEQAPDASGAKDDDWNAKPDRGGRLRDLRLLAGEENG